MHEMNESMYGYYGGYIFNINYNNLDSVPLLFKGLPPSSIRLRFVSIRFRQSVANSGIDLNHLAIYLGLNILKRISYE